jgi:hypothetical protein
MGKGGEVLGSPDGGGGLLPEDRECRRPDDQREVTDLG